MSGMSGMSSMCRGKRRRRARAYTACGRRGLSRYCRRCRDDFGFGGSRSRWAWAESEEQGRRAARWAAALVALSPTLIFFSVRLWSESLYLTVLLGALWALTTPPDALGGLTVDLTLLDGRVVYERA